MTRPHVKTNMARPNSNQKVLKGRGDDMEIAIKKQACDRFSNKKKLGPVLSPFSWAIKMATTKANQEMVRAKQAG